ncbi:uncharacterized protein LOC111561284 isoform X1 [Felis catus]|uniref:uncharacterized protein LOC111561284 isoform X1 n=1 Tax=Felis catus TaxID=9685 RepID=UPI001D19D18A|nr:uncharacterized protein LOC111561284 isoform X1 [Felis catus]
MRSQSLLMSHCVRLPTYSFVTFVASFQCSQSPAPLAFCHFTLQSCSNGARQPLAYYMAAPDPSGLLGEKAYRHLKNSSLAISSRPPPLSRTHSGPPCRRAKRYSEILEGRRPGPLTCHRTRHSLCLSLSSGRQSPTRPQNHSQQINHILLQEPMDTRPLVPTTPSLVPRSCSRVRSPYSSTRQAVSSSKAASPCNSQTEVGPDCPCPCHGSGHLHHPMAGAPSSPVGTNRRNLKQIQKEI